MTIRSQDEQLGGSGKIDQYSYLNDPYYSSAEYAAIVERQRQDLEDIRVGRLDDE